MDIANFAPIALDNLGQLSGGVGGRAMRAARIILIMAVGTILSSCTTHPLQNDVTRLPLSDIIHKITCEAKEALVGLLEKKKLGGRRNEFEKANKDLKALTKRVLKPRQKEGTQLNKARKELLTTKALHDSEENAILNILIIESKKNPNSTNVDLQDRLKHLDRVYEKYLRDLAEHIRAVGRYNRDLATAQSRVDAATTATKKRLRQFAPLYNHQMAYSFRFRAVETNAATALASYRFPVHLGTLTIGVSPPGLSDTKERDGERNAKLVVSFEDLHGTECDDAPPQADRLRAMRYPIKGKIGLEEVITQYFAILNRGKNGQDNAQESDDEEDREKAKKVFAKTDAYTDTIIFTTTLTASVTPSVILNPTAQELLNGSLAISGTRKDTHSVTVSLSAPDSDDGDRDQDKITRVQIIRDDDLFVKER